MAKLLPHVGDYTGRHDYCLYRVGHNGTSYTLSRCCHCGPHPEADAFSASYSISDEQLRRLLAYSLDPYHPWLSPSANASFPSPASSLAPKPC